MSQSGSQKKEKTSIRVLINDRLTSVESEIMILGDESKALGDVFTGVVCGAVQFGHRKWQVFDLVSGHRIHHQRKTYRSPKQALEQLENFFRRQRFEEDVTLRDAVKQSWFYSWYGGVPLLVNPVGPHLPPHIIFDDETWTPHDLIARPCPRCEKEDWKLYSNEGRKPNPEPDWTPDLAIECRGCGLRGEGTIHGIPHAMHRWNMAEWDENWENPT